MALPAPTPARGRYATHSLSAFALSRPNTKPQAVVVTVLRQLPHFHQNTTTGLIPRQVVRKGKLVNHRTWKQQVSGGMWVHWVQAGIDPVAWGELFVGNKRCLLKRTSPDARSSADAPASSADDKKRNRASLEEAFATAEAESLLDGTTPDRKSTRLNSSHLGISYAV